MKLRIVDQFGQAHVLEEPLTLTESKVAGICIETRDEAYALEKIQSWEPIPSGQIELAVAA